MGTITYGDKVAINENTDVADINKVNASDMNEIKVAVNDNDSKITGLKGTILWTNSNPTSSFAQQDITLSENNCDLLVWLYIRSTSSQLIISNIVPKGMGTIFFAPTSSGELARRGVFFVSGETYNVANVNEDNNDYDIPYMVIGYKTGVF